MTKPGARDARPLEPERLQRVARPRAATPATRRRPRAVAARARARAPRPERASVSDRDPEAQREEREQRIERDRVLDLDERDAPDGGHRNEREQRRASARFNQRARRYQTRHPFALPCRQPVAQVLDAFGRPLRDLRISVTDRCNFRCTYCMPKTVFGKDYRFLDRKELLELRGDHARSRRIGRRSASRSSASPAASRCCARHRAADRDARRARRST